MNPPTVQLQSDSPISSVALIDPPEPRSKTPAPAAQTEAENKKIRQAARALEQAAGDIREYGRQLVGSHREQLIRLSIEIAAKVLAKEIHDRNYDMERILSQALEEVPKGKPVTVKLNPEDLKTCQQTLSQPSSGPPESIQLTADWTVRPGECIVQTEQGVIEWIIEDHLKRISAALLGSDRKP